MASANYKPLPDISYLRESLRYDPDSGHLYWRNRPREHFQSDTAHISFQSQFPGQRLIRKDKSGYRTLTMNICGKSQELMAHRVAWAIYHGEDPGEKQIDHINRNPGDNRITNLRLVNQSENSRNTRNRAGNSKYRGVYFDKSKGKWKAQCQVGGKRKHLGYYPTDEAAARAYDLAINTEYDGFGVPNFGPTN